MEQLIIQGLKSFKEIDKEILTEMLFMRFPYLRDSLKTIAPCDKFDGEKYEFIFSDSDYSKFLTIINTTIRSHRGLDNYKKEMNEIVCIKDNFDIEFRYKSTNDLIWEIPDNTLSYYKFLKNKGFHLGI